MLQIRGSGVSHVVVRVPDVYFKNKTRNDAKRTYTEASSTSSGSGENDDDDVYDEDDDEDEDDDIVIYVDMHARLARHKNVSGSKTWSTEPGELTYYATLNDIKDAVSVQFQELSCIHNYTVKEYTVVELIEPLIPGSGQVHIFAKK